jgi:hypothetical protein
MSELKVWYDGIELTQWLKVTMGKDRNAFARENR